ncbi:hypothetical protein CLIB1423_14S01706 [[Candida] railenensis]|uniref:Uncharacterized protein n=1 Tax=[Candida] railenensis TaxID=45579 RepID=A0A9P0QSF9_9ASCO|nr:hypothetical protein CLIB1423_14S01706 [[Candida] railenensis]
MGLLSKFRSDRKKGHNRSETSSSSIIGSDFSTTGSDSSHSSADTNYKNFYHQKHHSQNGLQGINSPNLNGTIPAALQPQFAKSQQQQQQQQSTLSSSPQRKPPVGMNPTISSPGVSTLEPQTPRNLTPIEQQTLYSPKIRKPVSAKASPASQSNSQNGHMKSPSYSKSPLSNSHVPERDYTTAARPLGTSSRGHSRNNSDINTPFSLDPMAQSLRTVSRSSFAVTGSVMSESDFTSYEEEDDDEDDVSPVDPQQSKLEAQRQFFAQPPEQVDSQKPEQGKEMTAQEYARRQQLNQSQQSQQYPQPYQQHQYNQQYPQQYPQQYNQQYSQNYAQQHPQQSSYGHLPSLHSEDDVRKAPAGMLSNTGNTFNKSGSPSDLLSRKSTIKSSRRSSVPFSVTESKPMVGDRRASRVMSDNKENSEQGISHSSSGLSLNPNNYRYISDYEKFFDGGEEDEVSPMEKMGPSLGNKNVDKDDPKVKRSDSMGSEGSYNSIERGDSGKFKVGSKEERLERIQSNTKKFDEASKANQRMLSEQRKRASTPNLRSFLDNNSSHFVNDYSNMNKSTSFNSPRMSMMDFGGPSNPYGHIPLGTSGYAGSVYNMGANTEYNGSSAVQRQNLANAEAHRRSMYQLPYSNMYGHPHQHMMMSGPPKAPSSVYGGVSRSSSPSRSVARVQGTRINDPNIIKKIENYVALRKVIASGNKSLEYRLKWVNMLINSTNSRLYNYINIKGEPINPESIPQHRALFIKSSINHTLKLLKESEKNEEYEEIFSDICYIYGCLLKNDWVPLYGQNFGIERDCDEALKYFEKSVEIRGNNFKSFYKLGELYEDDLGDLVENPTEIALGHYKKSAQYGYNKAIFRISMIYLNVEQFRSYKCVNYLLDLANIDVNSKDINLEDDDRDELNHVVGMAAYQVGKIYEGLYPGDLSPDSEFISKCLIRAPVNYGKALTYYNKASKLQNLDAQVKLGQVYENGELNRQQNPDKSIQWFLKAASSQIPSKRHPDAMLGLSRWYLKGSGGLNRIIPYPEPQKALAWCDRAVLTESPEAFFTRGLLAEQGLGIDPPEQFYQRAFEMGHYEAGVKLGYNEPTQPPAILPTDEPGNGLYDFDSQYEIQSPQLSE